MKKLKICISISTYNAFEDMNLSANIIRSNWDDELELYLVAGLCKQNTFENLNKNLFDDYTEIETPKTHLVNISNNLNSFESQSARLFNSILETGKLANKNNCDYIIYLNSGSWILKPKKLKDLLSEISENTFGIRLMNRFKYLVIEDHFFVVNLRKAQNLKLYDVDLDGRIFNTMQASTIGIHGMLSSWINLAPFGEVYIYSDHTKSYDQHGNMPWTFNPLIFDEKYYFLHSNRNFNEIISLRKLYIEIYVENKNQFIKEFLDKKFKLPRGYKIYTKPIPHTKLKFLYRFINLLTFGMRGKKYKKSEWKLTINKINKDLLK